MEEQTCLGRRKEVRGRVRRWGENTHSSSFASGDTSLSVSGSPNNWLQEEREGRGRGEGEEREGGGREREEGRREGRGRKGGGRELEREGGGRGERRSGEKREGGGRGRGGVGKCQVMWAGTHLLLGERSGRE